MASEEGEGQIQATSEAWWRLVFSAILDVGESWPSDRDARQEARYERHLRWLQAVLEATPTLLQDPLFIAFDDWNLGLRAGPYWGAWVEETPYYFKTPQEIALYLGMRHVLDQLAKDDKSLLPEGTADVVYRRMPRKWCIVLRRASSGQLTVETLDWTHPNNDQSLWCITVSIPPHAEPCDGHQPSVEVYLGEAKTLWDQYGRPIAGHLEGRVLPRSALREKARALPPASEQYRSVIETMRQVSGSCPGFAEDPNLVDACERIARQLSRCEKDELCTLLARLVRTNYLFFALAPLDIAEVGYVPGRGFFQESGLLGDEEAVGGLHLWLGKDSAWQAQPVLALATIYCRRKAILDYARRAHHLLELLSDLPHTVLNYVMSSVKEAINAGDLQTAAALAQYVAERGRYIDSIANKLQEESGPRQRRNTRSQEAPETIVVGMETVARRIKELPIFAERHGGPDDVLAWNMQMQGSSLSWEQKKSAWKALIDVVPEGQMFVCAPVGCAEAFLENLVSNSLKHWNAREQKLVESKLDLYIANGVSDEGRSRQVSDLDMEIKDWRRKRACPVRIRIVIKDQELMYSDNGEDFDDDSATLLERWALGLERPSEKGLLYIDEALQQMGLTLASFDRQRKEWSFRLAEQGANADG